MSDSYQLKSSQQTFVIEKTSTLHVTNFNNNETSPSFYILNNDNLSKYEFNPNSTLWQNKWNESLKTNDSTNNRVLYFPTFTNVDNIVLVKTVQGIDFYRLENDDLNLIQRSNDHAENIFQDAFWNNSNNIIKTGHFYRNRTVIGLLTKHEYLGVQFYAIMPDALASNRYPIYPVSLNPNPFVNNSSTDFFLADIRNQGHQDIIIRNESGLKVYEFDENYEVTLVVEVTDAAKSDNTQQHSFFPNLTGQSFRDIVTVNKTGMFIYQYNHEQKNYVISHYNPLFSDIKGWTEEHLKSIVFEDINTDGFQEILFTGPRGIDILTFDRGVNQWVSYFDGSQSTIDARYGDITAVIPSNSAITIHPMIFIHYGCHLHWANIITTKNALERSGNSTMTIEQVKSDNLDTNKSVPLIPQVVIPTQIIEEKPVRLLRDYLDCSSVLDGLDRYTGRVKFHLPLVDLSNKSKDDIKLKFVYNGISQETGILGVGWFLPQSFITINHQSKVFQGSELYYIVIEDMPTQMILDADHSTDAIYSFTILNQSTSNTHIHYYKNEEKWEIKSSETTQIYGCIGGNTSTQDPITWEITWENWKGMGSSTTNQSRMVTSWYLAEVRHKNDVMKLSYDLVEESVPGGNKFTREIYLKGIKTLKNEVILKYTDKSVKEYKAPAVVDANGFIRQQMVISRYLSSYTVSTPDYNQNINFTYDEVNGKRYLIKIEQENDPVNKPIVQFAYKSILNAWFLENVTLPSETRVEFKYESFGKVSSTDKQLGTVKLDVPLNHKVNFIKDDVIVSYMDERGVIILQNFEENASNDYSISTIHSNLGQGLAKVYETIPAEDFLLVIIHYDSEKELYVFYKCNNIWKSTPKFVFNEDVVINTGKDFIITYEKNSPIYKIEWNTSSKQWQKEIFNTDIDFPLQSNYSLQVAVYNNMFLVYNNNIFWIAYKDDEQKWHSKKVKEMPGAMNTVEETIDKFYLDDEKSRSGRSRKLLKFFENFALKLYNNLFSLSRWYEKGGHLYTIVDLFVLNSRYEVAINQQFEVDQENLLELTKVDDNGIKYGYKISDGKFKNVVTDIQGKRRDELFKEVDKKFTINHIIGDNSKKKKEAIEKEKVKINGIFEKNPSENELFFNPWNHNVLLTSQTAICGNETFIFNGAEWKREKLNTKKEDKQNFLTLGDKFMLVKEHENSEIQLYNGTDEKNPGRSLLNLEITDFGKIFNAYPFFLAYQKNSTSSPQVIEFSNEEEFEKVVLLPHNEQLSLWSNYKMLVTMVQNNINFWKNITLVFHQMHGINKLLSNPVVIEVSIVVDKNIVRSTGYKYNSPKFYNNAVLYEELSIIPGNNETLFGSINEERNFKNPSEMKRKYFDGQNNLIKIQSLEQEHQEAADEDASSDQETRQSNTTIFDITGQFKVAEFFINNLIDDEVGYLGFEDYETNQINIKNKVEKWFFEKRDIIKNEFSLTGQNYLKLSENLLYGTFQPKNQNQDYIASCWIRPHPGPINTSIPLSYLTAIFELENNGEIQQFVRTGNIKYQLDDWYYLEVLVDFSTTRNMMKYYANMTSPEIKQLETTITVNPDNQFTIDIDHIRFSPLNSRFQATVYDPKTMLIKEEIRYDGLITRHIYDEYNEEIASIDENRHLEKFKTYTKSTSLTGRINHLNSVTQIQPEAGFYESFAPYSFENHWKIDTTEGWQISPNQLQHSTTNTHSLWLNLSEIDSKSFGIRMNLKLDTKYSLLKIGNVTLMSLNSSIGEFIFSGKRSHIPLDSEIIVLTENTRSLIWINGGLYFDGYSNDSDINVFSACGKVKISNVFIFNKPSVQTVYYNSLQEKIQVIQLENENSVIIKEYLYDELGRQTITIQPARLIRSNNQPLLIHHSNFVTNTNFYLEDSVWKTGQLIGESKDILGEYGYTQTKYYNNPLNEKRAIGSPGQIFSVYGPYAKQFSPVCNNLYVTSNYPTNKNYTHQVEYKPGEVKHITVLNEKRKKVADYIEIPYFMDILSTYEYDKKGNIIKILPPQYYEKTQKSTQIQSASHVLTEHSSLQKSLGIFMNYDENNNMITKETPDTQKVEHIYEEDLLKFTIYYEQVNHISNITYFDYDEFGRLRETGVLLHPYSRHDLLNLTLTQNNTQLYQQFDYNDFELEPTLRKKTRRIITYNKAYPLLEEFKFSTDQDIITKRISLPLENNEIPQMIEINKVYGAGKVVLIEYPVNIQKKPFQLTYTYNKLGQMVGIGVPGNNNFLATFTYNAAGQMNNETYLPNSNKLFTRQYDYNSAGFLTGIKDKFLSEVLSYVDKSYGGLGYGDGTITSTRFQANWHKYSNNRGFNLNKYSFVSQGITMDESELCFNKLRNAGYLNSDHHQVKMYYPKLHPDFPVICTDGVTSRYIQSILGSRGFPSHYGHSYDYGNHQELTKAKYFVGLEIPTPLQPDTFSKEIPLLNSTASRDIWEILLKGGYIALNKDKLDFSYTHGKTVKSFIRSTLYQDLDNINSTYRMYKHPLERMLVSCVAQKHDIASMKSSLKIAINNWTYYMDETNIKKVTHTIMEMLEKNQYLNNPFADEFSDILKKYQPYVPDIVRVLEQHFGNQLGEAEFDVESYEIDANGNHKLFYTGFDRYELNYMDNTNQINNVRYISFASVGTFKNFAMKHDNKGNVIQALHKGIQHIEYHPVSNRAIKMKLVDGRSLLFHYDVQGERIFKKLVGNKGETIAETHYIRDERGRTLVERKKTYISHNQQPDELTTTYVYGPRGLIGFYRRDLFYTVFLDHEGSIRLVIRGDEVVAAYDYLPYGDIARQYGNDPESHISYLYTSQELDEETNLYNFHARFYDPSIGRFYQMDPKVQYFSPYKYAGNSPVSMIDPDGELAILIAAIALGIAGAYLGGAAANDEFNPLDWELNKVSTWTGIVGGGIGGAFLPVGFIGSVGFFGAAFGISVAQATALTVGLGVGASYLNMAAVNGNWNPAEWKFTPATVNAAFQGFALGSGIGTGIRNANSFYTSLSKGMARHTFWVSTVSAGAGIFTVGGIAANWDFSNPLMYAGILDALTMATDVPMFLHHGYKFFKSHGNTIFRGGKYQGLYELSDLHEEIFTIIKAVSHNKKDSLKLLSTLIWGNTARKYPVALSTLAMTLGVGSIAVAGYVTYEGARERGADINSIFLYHSMITGMMAIGQLSLAYKSPSSKKTLYNKKYTQSHDVESSWKEVSLYQKEKSTHIDVNPSLTGKTTKT